MKLGLHVPDFTWPAGPSQLGPQLAKVAQAAEDAGFDRMSVMDHVWQISHIGPPEHEVLEAEGRQNVDQAPVLAVWTATGHHGPWPFAFCTSGCAGPCRSWSRPGAARRTR